MGLRRPKPPVTAWGRAFELAFEAGLAVVLGVIVGAWLDDRFDTSPVFILIFMALGFGVMVKRLLSFRIPAAPPDDGASDGSDRGTEP